MCILNNQRGLAHAAHALNGGATNRLRHGSGPLLHEDGVKPSEVVSAACKARDPWWHTHEWSWPRWWWR